MGKCVNTHGLENELCKVLSEEINAILSKPGLSEKYRDHKPIHSCSDIIASSEIIRNRYPVCPILLIRIQKRDDTRASIIGGGFSKTYLRITIEINDKVKLNKRQLRSTIAHELSHVFDKDPRPIQSLLAAMLNSGSKEEYCRIYLNMPTEVRAYASGITSYFANRKIIIPKGQAAYPIFKDYLSKKSKQFRMITPFMTDANIIKLISMIYRTLDSRGMIVRQ